MASKKNNNNKNSDPINELIETVTKNYKKENGNIHIDISYTFNIGNKEIHNEQRAEGGGQINKRVGTNANQGGQIAKDHSESSNDHSNFADGNGRSGIAGDDNDEAGGQQGIKVRDSVGDHNVVGSSSEQNEGSDQPEVETDEENI